MTEKYKLAFIIIKSIFFINILSLSVSFTDDSSRFTYILNGKSSCQTNKPLQCSVVKYSYVNSSYFSFNSMLGRYRFYKDVRFFCVSTYNYSTYTRPILLNITSNDHKLYSANVIKSVFEKVTSIFCYERKRLKN